MTNINLDSNTSSKRFAMIDSSVREILASGFERADLVHYALVAREFVCSVRLLPNFYSSVPEFVEWLTSSAVRNFEPTDARRVALTEISARIRNACFAARENDVATDQDMASELAVAQRAADSLC